MSEHWSDTVETTPEVKTAMAESKYESHTDWQVGAMNAMSTVGAPFRLPKSLESLPSDEIRADFHKGIAALQPEYDGKQLDDVNYAEGLADARKVNEEVKTAFMEFLKENKVSKALAQKIAAFSNGQATLLNNAQTKAASDKAEISKATIEGLFGGEEGVEKKTAAVVNMFDQHGGLTTDELEAVTGVLKSGIAGEIPLAKGFFNVVSALMKEGVTDAANQQHHEQKQTRAAKLNQALPESTKHLWPQSAKTI